MLVVCGESVKTLEAPDVLPNLLTGLMMVFRGYDNGETILLSCCFIGIVVERFCALAIE